MEKDWIIIGVVIFFALMLIAWLVIRNERDKEDLDVFLHHRKEDDEELNDEK